MIARNPGDLSGVLDATFGRWLRLEDVLFDPDARTLSVSLARPAPADERERVRNLGWLYRSWRVALRETVLTIHHVRDHDLAPAGGEWRASGIGFDGDTVAILSAGVPVIAAWVDDLEVTVEESPTVVGERLESCLFGFLRRYAVRRLDRGPA